MNQTKNPIGLLNSLRGVAALMVCLFHSAFIIKDYNPEFYKSLDWGQEGVYVFFVISGVVLPWSMLQGKYSFKNFGRFMLKRILRLYPPFVISVLVFVIGIWIMKDDRSFFDTDVFNQFVDSIFFLVPFKESKWVIEVYWTLFVEFQYYIYLALIFPFLVHKRLPVRLLAYYGTIALTFLSHFFVPNHTKENLFFHLPIFCLGFSLFLYYKQIIGKWEFWSGVVVASVVGFVNINNFLYLSYHITLVSLVTFFLIYFVKQGPRFLDFLGDVSYSFYLFHLVFVSYIYGKFYHEANDPFWVWFVFWSIQLAAIVGAWAMYNLVEKPSLNWTKKVKYKV
jgi:peptidoglycan/LPS O-acetylase OafA/YrhL